MVVVASMAAPIRANIQEVRSIKKRAEINMEEKMATNLPVTLIHSAQAKTIKMSMANTNKVQTLVRRVEADTFRRTRDNIRMVKIQMVRTDRHMKMGP